MDFAPAVVCPIDGTLLPTVVQNTRMQVACLSFPYMPLRLSVSIAIAGGGTASGSGSGGGGGGGGPSGSGKQPILSNAGDAPSAPAMPSKETKKET